MSSLECPGSKTSSFRKAGLREKLKWCKGAWCTDSCVTGDLSIRINWTHLEITRITLDDTSCSLNVESRLIFPFIYTATAYTLRSFNTAFPSSSYLSKSVFKSSLSFCLLDLYTFSPQDVLQWFYAQNLI